MYFHMSKTPLNKQLDLFSDQERIVRTVSTDLGSFGNRTDIFVVGGDVVRGTSLLECDNADVYYFNNMSDLREGLMNSIKPGPGDTGPLGD